MSGKDAIIKEYKDNVAKLPENVPMCFHEDMSDDELVGVLLKQMRWVLSKELLSPAFISEQLTAEQKKQHNIITGGGGARMINKPGVYHAINKADLIIACPEAVVFSYGCTVSSISEGTVHSFGGIVHANYFARVYAYDHSTVYATGRSYVSAQEDSHVTMTEHAKGEAVGRSHVVLKGMAVLYASGDASVEAFDNTFFVVVGKARIDSIRGRAMCVDYTKNIEQADPIEYATVTIHSTGELKCGNKFSRISRTGGKQIDFA